MMLEKKVMDILERNNFGCKEVIQNDNGKYTAKIYEQIYSVKWFWTISFDGTTGDFIESVYETACNFNIDDAVEKYRNKFSSITDTVHYMEDRRANLFELYNRLDGWEPDGKYLAIKKLREHTERYLSLENDLMDAGEATDVMNEIEDAAVDLLIDGTDMTADELFKILDSRRK